MEGLVSGLSPQPGTPVNAPRHAAMRQVEEEFVALVCADAQLLRAEFDAIIAQEWGSPSLPPGPLHRSRFPARPPQRRRRRTDRPADQLTGPQHDPGGDGRSRERGPPPR